MALKATCWKQILEIESHGIWKNTALFQAWSVQEPQGSSMWDLLLEFLTSTHQRRKSHLITLSCLLFCNFFILKQFQTDRKFGGITGRISHTFSWFPQLLIFDISLPFSLHYHEVSDTMLSYPSNVTSFLNENQLKLPVPLDYLPILSPVISQAGWMSAR